MNHHTISLLAATGLAGCLLGLYDLDDAELVVEGSANAYYGVSIDRFMGDNDFYSELAVGAPLADTVHIYWDVELNDGDGELSLDESVTFEGETGGEAGWSLASGELVDSTWFSDLVIGAPNEASGAGRVYVLSGGSLRGDIAAEGYTTFVGERGDYAGWALAVGDINGDGRHDLVVGACGADSFTGRVYGVYGPFDAGEHDLSDADVIIDGTTEYNQFGCAVEVADLDQDGQDDIIVGEFHATAEMTGNTWVIYEHTVGTRAVDAMNHAVRLAGETHTGTLGWSLSAGGDVNGDGVDDLAIGAPGSHCPLLNQYSPAWDCDQHPSGVAYLVLGEAGVRLTDATISDVADALRYETGTEGLGHSVSIEGDVNGDGYDDVLVGTHSGHGAMLQYGSPALSHTSTHSSKGFSLVMDSSDTDYAGQVVFMDHWDLDGDGADEMFIAATNQQFYLDGGQADAGKVYVPHGERDD